MANAKLLIAEVVCALEFLHQNNILFRDLKPEKLCRDAGFDPKKYVQFVIPSIGWYGEKVWAGAVAQQGAATQEIALAVQRAASGTNEVEQDLGAGAGGQGRLWEV